MIFGFFFHGRDDGEHKGVGLVDISKTFVTHCEFFIGTEPFDRMFLMLLREDSDYSISISWRPRMAR